MNSKLTSSQGTKESENAIASPWAEFALTKDAIVNLPLARIHEMSRNELIAIIRFADVPFFHGDPMEHLPYADRETLERLAFLAQRRLRNQGDHASLPKK